MFYPVYMCRAGSLPFYDWSTFIMTLICRLLLYGKLYLHIWITRLIEIQAEWTYYAVPAYSRSIQRETIFSVFKLHLFQRYVLNSCSQRVLCFWTLYFCELCLDYLFIFTVYRLSTALIYPSFHEGHAFSWRAVLAYHLAGIFRCFSLANLNVLNLQLV